MDGTTLATDDDEAEWCWWWWLDDDSNEATTFTKLLVALLTTFVSTSPPLHAIVETFECPAVGIMLPVPRGEVLTGEPVVTAETAAARAAATAAFGSALVVNVAGVAVAVAAAAVGGVDTPWLVGAADVTLVQEFTPLLPSEPWYDLMWKFKLCSYLKPLPHAKQTNECILDAHHWQIWYGRGE